ncbi:MAG: hypothetical protein AB1454_08115 [Candidatus Auribacterota bacterium]
MKTLMTASLITLTLGLTATSYAAKDIYFNSQNDYVRPQTARSSTSYFVVGQQAAHSSPYYNATIQKAVGCSFDLEGNPLPAGKIAFSNMSLNPDVASNGTNFLVVWLQTAVASGENKQVRGQLISAQGEKIGAEIVINESWPGLYGEVAVASDGYDYFVIWTESYHSTRVLGRKVAADGTLGEVKVILGMGFARSIDIESNKYPYETYRSYMVVYSYYPYNGWNRGYNICGQLLDFNGNTIIPHTEIATQYLDQHHENVNISTNGFSYLVAWDTAQSSTAYAGIRGRAVYSFVNVFSYMYFLSSEMQISTNDGTQIEVAPAAAGGRDYYYLVTWQAEDTGSLGIFGQFVTYYGTKLGEEFRLNAKTYRDQQCPAVASDSRIYSNPNPADLRRFVIWASNHTDAGSHRLPRDGYNLYGDFFTTSDRNPK